MTDETVKALPELPTEAWNAAPGRLYTADQMRDYAAAAIEQQAAKVEALESGAKKIAAEMRDAADEMSAVDFDAPETVLRWANRLSKMED